jgi:hypothetical protein
VLECVAALPRSVQQRGQPCVIDPGESQRMAAAVRRGRDARSRCGRRGCRVSGRDRIRGGRQGTRSPFGVDWMH